MYSRSRFRAWLGTPKPTPTPRHIAVNLEPTEHCEHPNNQIQTAKYSLLTFIPRNLAEQFRRIANAFFLLIVILQFLPQFAQLDPILGALPLLLVLATTAAKDAYEDVRRHAADHTTNHQLTDRLSHPNPNITKPVSSNRFSRQLAKLILSPHPQSQNRPWSAPRRTLTTTTTTTTQPAKQLDSHGFVPTAWQDLRVGDFIRLKNDEPVPADAIICATSDPEENVCFVETKNLDGETNLKARHALPALSHLRSAEACADPATNRFVVENEAPDPDLNTEWVIALIVLTGPDTKVMLNSKSTPSKRSKVERQMNPMVFINLAILAFMCIFNGIGTRIAESYFYERDSYWTVGSDLPDDNPRINGLVGFANALVTYQNIVPISLYISIEFVRTLQAYFIWADDELQLDGRRTLARAWNLSDDLGQIQYIFSDKTGTLTQNLMQFKKCTIGGIIYQGSPARGAEDEGTEKWEEMHESDSPPKGAASSGTQLEPPFTDTRLLEDLLKGESELLQKFWTCLGLCHTVLAHEDDNGSVQYKAQSPDEAALVQAAADVGYVFRGRDKNVVKLQLPAGLGGAKAGDEPVESADIPPSQDPCTACTGIVDEYELLEVNEFTSLRKRMSVVVQKLKDQRPIPDELYLFVKGADNVIFERLAPGQEALRAQIDGQLETFAAEGLRTLTLAYRKLDRAQLEAWSLKYAHALSQLGDARERLIEAVQDELENGLILLGATAIEDKLQDGVPEAISDLKRAGIKVWVATGDKLETAVAIAKSCQLIGSDMNLIVVRGNAYGQKASAYQQIRKALIDFFDGQELVDDLKHLPPDYERRPSLHSAHRRPSMAESMADDLASLVGQDNGKRAGGYGLVIDGPSLNHALEEKFTREALLELSTRCEAVICCRASPKQKSEIVKLVKDGVQALTLAIGDGANDVSMIQTAHIGVGVLGEEGMQAVNASDYSIGQFKLIAKLLFVHGHWSYHRNAKMICHFFYQQIIGIVPLFLFQFSCAYSTTTLFEYTYVLLYNVAWTLLPAIGMGIFDQDISEKVLKQVPELYSVGREGKLFGVRKFIIYMIEGTYQGAIIYAILAFTYSSNSVRRDGWDPSMDEFSSVVIVSTILACNLFIALGQLNWNWWAFGCVSFGPVTIVLYTAVYSAVKPDENWTTVYGNNKFIWPAPCFWFALILSIVASLLPRYLLNYYQSTYHPTDIQILKEVDRRDPGMDFRVDDRINCTRQRNSDDEETRSRCGPRDKEPANTEKDEKHHSELYADSYVNISKAELRRSRNSFTLDMATGQSSSVERGFNFDQADGVGEHAVGARLRRFNSSVMSLASPIEARETPTWSHPFARNNYEIGDLNRVAPKAAGQETCAGPAGTKFNQKRHSSSEVSNQANRTLVVHQSNQLAHRHMFPDNYRIQTADLTETLSPLNLSRRRSLFDLPTSAISPQTYVNSHIPGAPIRETSRDEADGQSSVHGPLAPDHSQELQEARKSQELGVIREELNRPEIPRNTIRRKPVPSYGPQAAEVDAEGGRESLIPREGNGHHGDGQEH
ncbi:hypothetical protein PtB15_11B679 [Puccinia triticina]|nr:hypothetical protein PtB15_11B679 [Puccinia triticina]